MTIGPNYIDALAWLMVGGFVGLTTSIVLNCRVKSGVVLNMMDGVIGGVLGGWLLAPLAGLCAANQNTACVPAIAMAAIVSTSLLALVNRFGRGR